jgi:hypothetical protein
MINSNNLRHTLQLEFDESLQLGVVPFPIDDDKITDFSLEET